MAELTADIRDALARARALIATEGAWTDHKIAVDSEGNDCHWNDVQAKRFSLIGAIYVSNKGESIHTADRAVKALFPKFTFFITEAIRFNQMSSHSEVLALLDSFLGGSA